MISESDMDSIETENYKFVIAISDPKIRKKVRKKNQKIKYGNLIHPDSSISNSAMKKLKKRRGNIICAGARLAGNVEMGNFCILNLNSTVGHDCIVGDYSNIMPGANISGNVHVMQESVIGTGASILQGASQEERLQVGPKSTVGIGSVVMRSVQKERTVFGSPAEVLASE